MYYGHRLSEMLFLVILKVCEKYGRLTLLFRFLMMCFVQVFFEPWYTVSMLPKPNPILLD